MSARAPGATARAEPSTAQTAPTRSSVARTEGNSDRTRAPERCKGPDPTRYPRQLTDPERRSGAKESAASTRYPSRESQRSWRNHPKEDQDYAAEAPRAYSDRGE